MKIIKNKEFLEFQRIITTTEWSNVCALPQNKIYKHNSSKRNTTLTKNGVIVVFDMFWGQFDAVTYNKETGDKHIFNYFESAKI